MNGRLVWDKVTERKYETGVSKGVYYPYQADGTYGAGEAWNGLTQVTESPSGAESNPIYADNTKYLDLRSAEDFGATIEAYTFPAGFAISDGKKELMPGVHISQQKRSPFGFSYQTIIGNDTEYNDYGYTIHLVYGATASPSEKTRSTVNDSPEATAMSWECTTVPVAVPGFKPTAHLEIDSTLFTAAQMAAIEKALYGADVSAAVYAPTTDTAPQTGKTYYTKSDNTYTQFSGSTFTSGTTYYEMVSPAVAEATESYLPLPAEVVSILEGAA